MSSPSPNWDELRAAYAEGRCVAEGEGDRERIQFDSGVTWLPSGKEFKSTGGLLLALAWACFGLTLMGVIVTLAERLPFFVPAVLALLAAIALLTVVLRREHRLEAEARRRLELGLFLFPDEIIVRDHGFDERVRRERVRALQVRYSRRGGQKALPWIHIVLDDGNELSTDLLWKDEIVSCLEAWLEEGRRRRGADAALARS